MKAIGKKEEDAMSNKKFPKLAVLSLLGLLALTSCGSDDSEVKSLPSNYNDPVITIDDVTETIHNNLVSIIADQFHDGELPSKTLDKLMFRYAESVYGSYNTVTRADNDSSVTLKDAVESIYPNYVDPEHRGAMSGTHEDAVTFIRAHKVFWTYNDKGEHVDDQGAPVTDDTSFEPSISELGRVVSRFEDIEKRIAENMFAKAKASGYVEKNFFKEAKYVKSLYDAGQDVIKYTMPAVEAVVPMIIEYTVEGKDVFTDGILHREFYQSDYLVTDPESAAQGFHYIEKEIVPQVYNDLLVEQYLLDEESNAVKQSRARQINVIKIEKYSGFQINANLLVRQLVDEIYSRKPDGQYLSYIDEDNNPYEKIFEKYEDISKGLTVYDPTSVVVMEEDEIYDGEGNIIPTKYEEYWSAKQIIARIHKSRPTDAFNYKTSAQGKAYYENTTYGDLVEDYEEFWSAESFEEIDTSLRNKFTSNGTVSPEEGFDQEKISLSQVQAITKGWYIQKSAPSLDSNGKIKDNLFQVSIANNKLEAKDGTDAILKYDNLEKGLVRTDRYEVTNVNGNEVEWDLREEKSPLENKYICSINGAYFLKFDGDFAGSDYKNDIVCEDSSAYYICQVIEAAKDVKLRNSDYDSSYAKTRQQGFLEKVISEITHKVAETGSYASLSKEYWLEKMNITYHDQSVYDYFKSNYPDLFKE